MKRLTAILLATALLASVLLSACSSETENQTSQPKTTEVQQDMSA